MDYAIRHLVEHLGSKMLIEITDEASWPISIGV
jgi:hypothetical protein